MAEHPLESGQSLTFSLDVEVVFFFWVAIFTVVQAFSSVIVGYFQHCAVTELCGLPEPSPVLRTGH